VVCRLFCSGPVIEKPRLGRIYPAVLRATATVRIIVEKQGHLNDASLLSKRVKYTIIFIFT